jgi:tetratricopeptide (TPR) repeat protein
MRPIDQKRIDLNAAAQKAARLPELDDAGQEFFAAGNMEAAKAFYEAMLGSEPESKNAHAGLYYVYSALGDKHRAASHLGSALAWPAILKLPFRGVNAPVPVLLLLSLNSGNVLLQRFLNDRIFQTYVVLIESCNDAVSLPEHRLILNGVGDADVRSEALLAAERVLMRSTAPVINPPYRVLATGRCNNAQRLGKIPGVRAPRSVAYTRERLMDAAAPQQLREQGFEFSLLVRAPGFHMGKNFVRVESPGDLAAAVAELPGDGLIVMEYLDGCGSDGNIRKYRVLTIGGKLYPVHLAIAKQWKIHYFSADMADHCEHREEESRFLGDMEAALGPRIIETLKQIQESLGLDYGGIDFGLNAQGEVLLYEANATMAVYRPDASPKWDYRRASIERIYAAVQELFLSRANAACFDSLLLNA